MAQASHIPREGNDLHTGPHRVDHPRRSARWSPLGVHTLGDRGMPRTTGRSFTERARRASRLRGRPRPRRAMRTACISGMNRGQSPCWPGLRIRATGRQRRFAARWILVLSPLRERPSPSRPSRAAGFLSFTAAPRDQVRGQGPARAGGMLVRADHGGIGAEPPALPLGLIAAAAARPGSPATSRHPTSGDAGYRRSSSSRTPPPGHATGNRSGSGRRFR